MKTQSIYALINVFLSFAAVISSPHRAYGLFRNPRNKDLGKFLTLSDFLLLPNRYKSLSGILIKVEVGLLYV